MLRRLVLVVASFAVCSYSNARPEFPKRNEDTRTIQYINGVLQTTRPYIPVMDFSLDGRIGVVGNKESLKLRLILPEKIQTHLQDPAHESVGANIISPIVESSDFYSFLKSKSEAHVSSEAADGRLGNKESADVNDYSVVGGILCEKTEIQKNPYVCGNSDCYDLTVVSRFKTIKNRISNKNDEGQNLKNGYRFISATATIKVRRPKTAGAYIESITVNQDSFRIGEFIPFHFSAESNIVGDQRLIVWRMGGAKLKNFNSNNIGGNGKHNLVYSTYPADQEQCNPELWTDLFPISYAYSDTGENSNNMRERYKFARYPLRDSTGKVIDPGVDIGGSYPWLDEDAANLFFTHSGNDRFYNEINGQMKVPYEEPAAGPDYDTPKSAGKIDKFESSGNTTGLSVAGFWTFGKIVVLDGLLNNTDYLFEVSTNNVSPKDMTRLLKLYNRAPVNQIYEPTGMTRERGDNVIKDDLHPDLQINTDIFGSLENKFNYLEQMKPTTPKDVVWHVQNGRLGTEVTFDDYTSPFVLINTPMNAAIVPNKHGGTLPGITFDGIKEAEFIDSLLIDDSSRAFNAPLDQGSDEEGNDFEHYLVFQNAATSPDSILKVPSYGLPHGSGMRVEPIAKGGIYGKGLWMSWKNGLQFEVPDQTGDSTNIDLTNQKDWYVGVFVDPRWSNPNGVQEHVLFQIDREGYNMSIVLAKSQESFDNAEESHIGYDYLRVYRNGELVGHRALPPGLEFYHKTHTTWGWRHIGIQFHDDRPQVLIDGMKIGKISATGNGTTYTLKNLFRPQSGDKITLGRKPGGADGVRGWFDEFKVIARKITNHEEQCNIARGTLALPSSGSPSGNKWVQKSNLYGKWVTREISNALGKIDSNGNPVEYPRYVCVAEYGNDERMSGSNFAELVVTSPKTHLKNLDEALPGGYELPREQLLTDGAALIYDQPRPDQSTNSFCLSCHLSPARVPFAELNISALQPISKVVQLDDRRQPSQPPRILRGIIPKNYFGPGMPSEKLKSKDWWRVDQWILPHSNGE